VVVSVDSYSCQLAIGLSYKIERLPWVASYRLWQGRAVVDGNGQEWIANGKAYVRQHGQGICHLVSVRGLT